MALDWACLLDVLADAKDRGAVLGSWADRLTIVASE